MTIRSLAASSLLLLLAVGCGPDTSGRVKVYPIKGKITMNGGPLTGAIVTFSPLDGQPVATGRTNDQGEYQLTTYDPLDGAAAGNYKVMLYKRDPASVAAAGPPAHGVDAEGTPAGAHTGNGGAATASDSLIPDVYTKADSTTLQTSVKAGDNEDLNFDLQ
ncbi:MAG: hypothetical protein KDA88_23920 [Planctomycetaceae bacterium]|nr:hypothetical protein [Planctomycetaceae bacterium]MCB9952059.1 hypothetical protein [Planctomycetaceae bacterium]